MFEGRHLEGRRWRQEAFTENMGSPRGWGASWAPLEWGEGQVGRRLPGNPAGPPGEAFPVLRPGKHHIRGLGQQRPAGRGTEAEDTRDGALQAQLPKPQSGDKYVKHVTPQAWPWVSDPLDRLQTNYRLPAAFWWESCFPSFRQKQICWQIREQAAGLRGGHPGAPACGGALRGHLMRCGSSSALGAEDRFRETSGMLGRAATLAAGELARGRAPSTRSFHSVP